MARSYNDIVKDADSISDKISTQVRTLGLGLLAFTWGVLAGQAQIAHDLAAARRWQLLFISLAAISGLLMDLFQYVFGYQLTLSTLKAMDASGKSEGLFDTGSYQYKLRFFCFYAKQWIIGLATTWLLLTVLIFIVRHA